MLFQPMINGINEMKTYRGLKMSQKNMNAIRLIMRKANASPISEMGHQFLGSRYGAKQASKKTTATNIFTTRKIIFVNRL